jgi:hypothetical protein
MMARCRWSVLQQPDASGSCRRTRYLAGIDTVRLQKRGKEQTALANKSSSCVPPPACSALASKSNKTNAVEAVMQPRRGAQAFKTQHKLLAQ